MPDFPGALPPASRIAPATSGTLHSVVLFSPPTTVAGDPKRSVFRYFCCPRAGLLFVGGGLGFESLPRRNLFRKNMAEREGFEPSVRFYPYNRLAGGCLQPARPPLPIHWRRSFRSSTRRRNSSSSRGTAGRISGRGSRRICHALSEIASLRPSAEILYPVHLNPNVQESVRRILGTGKRPNTHLIGPVDYLPFVYLMMRSHLILTDSGGIQEEAPSLGKPVLVMREFTERPEAVMAGTARLVGTDREKIVAETLRLLDDREACRAMSVARNPYGGRKGGRQDRRLPRVLDRVRPCLLRWRVSPYASRSSSRRWRGNQGTAAVSSESLLCQQRPGDRVPRVRR